MKNNEFINRTRFFLGLWSGKFTKLVLKLAHKRVPYYPGTIAGKVYPDIKKYLSKPKTIIAVTGTNGKSTTCNLLLDFFSSQGLKTINNNTYNTSAGILACLLDSVNWLNKQQYDVAILEVDELTSKRILKDIPVDYMIVTNLFLDSIEKNGTPEFMASRIEDAIQENTKLILNADDALVSSLGNQNTIYYGFKKLKTDHKKPYNILKDMVLCPKCHQVLKYTNIKYGHIGSFSCDCGYKRKKPKYEICDLNFESSYFVCNDYIFHLNFHNIPNTYNVLGVISLLKEMGYKDNQIEDSFKKIEILGSRYSKVTKDNKTIIQILAKGQNPVADSQSFELCKMDSNKKDVVLLLDDANDSRRHYPEVEEWLYDTDFEFFNDANINRIIVGGRRSKDYVVRLLLAGIPKEKIFHSYIEEEVSQLVDFNSDLVYLFNDIWIYEKSLKIKEEIFDRWTNEKN